MPALSCAGHWCRHPAGTTHVVWDIVSRGFPGRRVARRRCGRAPWPCSAVRVLAWSSHFPPSYYVSHVCDSHDSCSRRCISFTLVLLGQRAVVDQFRPSLIDQSAEPVEASLPVYCRSWRYYYGHQTDNALVLPPASTMAHTRRVVLSSSTAHTAVSSRTFTTILSLSSFSMAEVSATTVVSLMVRRTTKTEIFPNVLGRLFLFVATVAQYRKSCLAVSFIFPRTNALILLGDSSSSTVKDTFLGILDDLLTPCPVHCFAVPLRLRQLCSGRGEMQICYSFFRIFLPCVIAFDVEQLTCNVKSSMSFGSMMVSSVSPSTASSASGCSSLTVPACKWQCFANCSTEITQILVLRLALIRKLRCWLGSRPVGWDLRNSISELMSNVIPYFLQDVCEWSNFALPPYQGTAILLGMGRFRTISTRDTSYLGPSEQQQETCDKTGTNEKHENRWDNVRRLSKRFSASERLMRVSDAGEEDTHDQDKRCLSEDS